MAIGIPDASVIAPWVSVRSTPCRVVSKRRALRIAISLGITAARPITHILSGFVFRMTSVAGGGVRHRLRQDALPKSRFIGRQILIAATAHSPGRRGAVRALDDDGLRVVTGTVVRIRTRRRFPSAVVFRRDPSGILGVDSIARRRQKRRDG